MKASQHKLLIFSTLLLFFAANSLAQNYTVEGIVYAPKEQEVLIGATVQFGRIGTITDLDGYFKLSVPKGEKLLTITYIGYESYQKKIKVSQDLNLGQLELKATANILETATVTSGKFEKPLGEVTVSLEVVKPKLLAATNATSVADVLDKIPGVNIIDGQANIRGGSGWSYGAGSRVLLLVDDIPALQADAGFPSWGDLPVENIEQIEVVKGASSALYGSSALNGVINVRTAYAKSEPVTKLSTFFLTFLEPKNEAQKWWNGDNFPYRTGMSFSHRRKIGKFDLVVGGYGQYNRGLTQNAFNRFSRINTSMRYRITPRLSFGANTNFNYGKSRSFFYWANSGEGAYKGGGDNSTSSSSEKLRYIIDPFLTYFDKSGSQHKFLGRYYSISNDNSNDQSNQSDLYYGEYQFQHKYDDYDMVFTAGVVGMKSFVSAELYGDTTHTTSNLAAYAQLDKKVFNKLNLSFGARYERNRIQSPEELGGDEREAKPVFRFGANYQLAKSSFLRASFGQGYRFPTIAERAIETNANGIFVIPNPELHSETGWSTEIGIKQGLKFGAWMAYVDLAAFWTEYQDMMEFIFTIENGIGFRSENIGNTRISGFEVSIGGQGHIGQVSMDLIAGYNFIDPKYKEFGEKEKNSSSAEYNVLKYRYKHSAKLDTEWGWNKVFLGTTIVYNSNMEAVDRALYILPDVKDFREANTNGYVAWDVRTGYEFTKDIRVSFMVKNLLNQEYMARPGKIEAPRNITFRMDYTF